MAARSSLYNKKKEEAMVSRAELLAGIEEKRLESKRIQDNVDELSIAEPGAADGYNPYDHPGQCKEIPDDAGTTARRREKFLRNRQGVS